MTDASLNATPPHQADAYDRVALACSALTKSGTPLGPRPVHRWMKQHLGTAAKWEAITPLIQRWESETKQTSTTRGRSKEAAEPPPPVEVTLENYPSLAPLLDQVAAAMAAMLGRQEVAAEADRHRLAAFAREEERAAAAASLAAANERHSAEVAELNSIIQSLRTAEGEMGAELENLQAALAKKSETEETLRQNLAAITAEKADVLLQLNSVRQQAQAQISRLKIDLLQARSGAEGGQDARAKLASEVAELHQQVAQLREEVVNDKTRAQHLQPRGREPGSLGSNSSASHGTFKRKGP